MISKKNCYSLEKTKKFLKKYRFVMIYQHNNLTVKQHIECFQSLKIDEIKTLVVKNSIVDQVLLKSENIQLKNVVQGPLFLIGCQNLEQVQTIWNSLKTSLNFLFLGCLINNHIYTHLDIQKSFQLTSTIYYEYFAVLDEMLNFKILVDYQKMIGQSLDTTRFLSILSLFLNKKNNL